MKTEEQIINLNTKHIKNMKKHDYIFTCYF